MRHTSYLSFPLPVGIGIGVSMELYHDLGLEGLRMHSSRRRPLKDDPELRQRLGDYQR